MCARRGSLKGRNRARPGPYSQAQPIPKPKPGPKPKPAPQPKAAPKAAAVAPPAPAAPPNPVRIFRNGTGPSWLSAVALDLADVSHTRVLMCVYCYDDLVLHQSLLDRLGAGLNLKVVVDSRYLRGNTCYRQRGRLKALREAGGEVAECSGLGQRVGNMHYKIIVMLAAGGQTGVAYHGGANPTKASRSSWECMTRFSDDYAVKTFATICRECWAAATDARLDCSFG